MIRQCVRRSFKGDSDILKFFDPQYHPANEMEAADIVTDKIIEHLSWFDCAFVRHPYGYFFYIKKKWFRRAILISFCMQKEFRSKENSTIFWEDIRRACGKKFTCLLYTRNSRAIKWLVKMGMRVEDKDNLVTTLKF